MQFEIHHSYSNPALAGKTTVVIIGDVEAKNLQDANRAARKLYGPAVWCEPSQGLVENEERKS